MIGKVASVTSDVLSKAQKAAGTVIKKTSKEGVRVYHASAQQAQEAIGRAMVKNSSVDLWMDILKTRGMGYSASRLGNIKNSRFVRLVTSVVSKDDDALHKINKIAMGLSQERLAELDSYAKYPIFRKIISDYHKNTCIRDFNIEETLMPRLQSTRNFLEQKAPAGFREILLKRNARETNAITELFYKQVNGISDKDKVKEIFDLMTYLLEAKAPDNKPLFGVSNASDKTAKMFMYGIENIVNAKNNDPKKFQQLMQLVELSKEGKIQPHILRVMSSNGEISPLVLSDIEHVLAGIDIVPKFKGMQEALSGCSEGDVVNVAGRLLVNAGDELKELKMDEKTYLELFEPVKRFAFAQGRLGDCYLVSALSDFMRNPKARVKLYEMFEQKGDDIIVRIPDMPEFPINFASKKVPLEGSKHIEGSLGIKMLENAYAQTRTFKHSVEEGISSIEGGLQSQVYEALLGKPNSITYTTDSLTLQMFDSMEDAIKLAKDPEYYKVFYQKQAAEMQKQGISEKDWQELVDFGKGLGDAFRNSMGISEASMDRNLGELNQIQKRVAGKTPDQMLELLKENAAKPDRVLSAARTTNISEILGDNGEFAIEDKLITPMHAYSIESVNPKDGTIYVINPWNCAQRIKLTPQEFRRCFNTLQIAQIS